MPEREHEHAAAAAQGNHGGGRRLLEIAAGTGGRQPGASQVAQRLGEAGAAPVEDVVVGQHAAVDLRRGECGHVLGVHAVVDALALQAMIARRHAGLEVDDPGIRGHPVQFGQRISPHVRPLDATWHRAALPFGELHVVPGRAHMRLEEPRVRRAG